MSFQISAFLILSITILLWIVLTTSGISTTGIVRKQHSEQEQSAAKVIMINSFSFAARSAINIDCSKCYMLRFVQCAGISS